MVLKTTMAWAGKFYVVRVGREPGIYLTWPEAKEKVQGFPGAIYKSFSSQEEAIEYLNQGKTPSTMASTPSRHLPPVVIYTDGSYTPYRTAKKGRPAQQEAAGYGLIILDGEETYVAMTIYGPFILKHPTSQRAELLAILRAIDQLYPGQVGLLKTDSMYSINCLTEWIYTWLKNGWKKADGEPVENRDLIEKIWGKLKRVNIKFQHVKAHQGDKYNEMVDGLANDGRISPKEIIKT